MGRDARERSHGGGLEVCGSFANGGRNGVEKMSREIMKTLEKSELQLKQEEIAGRALHRWENAGRHHHHDMEIWLEAEGKLGAALPSERARETPAAADVEYSSAERIQNVLAPAW